jgi:hypothetical protein
MNPSQRQIAQLERQRDNLTQMLRDLEHGKPLSPQTSGAFASFLQTNLEFQADGLIPMTNQCLIG